VCASQVPACNNPKQILRIRNVWPPKFAGECVRVCLFGCLCSSINIMAHTRSCPSRNRSGPRRLWFLVSATRPRRFLPILTATQALSSPHYIRHLPRPSPIFHRPPGVGNIENCSVSPGGWWCCWSKRAMDFKWNVLEQLEWVRKILIRPVSLAHFYVSYLCTEK